MTRSTALTSLLAATALIGVTLAMAPAAHSRTPGMGQGAMMGNFDFAAADADSDGKVTEDELRAYRAARAASLDADGDGKISEAELVASALRGAETRATVRAQRMIARFDTDADGALSAAELLAGGAGLGAMFDRLDRDEDGALSQAELAEGRERMMKRAEGGPRADRRAERRAERHGDGSQVRRGWDKRGDHAGRHANPDAQRGAAQD